MFWKEHGRHAFMSLGLASWSGIVVYFMPKEVQLACAVVLVIFATILWSK